MLGGDIDLPCLLHCPFSPRPNFVSCVTNYWMGILMPTKFKVRLTFGVKSILCPAHIFVGILCPIKTFSVQAELGFTKWPFILNISLCCISKKLADYRLRVNPEFDLLWAFTGTDERELQSLARGRNFLIRDYSHLPAVSSVAAAIKTAPWTPRHPSGCCLIMYC